MVRAILRVKNPRHNRVPQPLFSEGRDRVVCCEFRVFNRACSLPSSRGWTQTVVFEQLVALQGITTRSFFTLGLLDETSERPSDGLTGSCGRVWRLCLLLL